MAQSKRKHFALIALGVVFKFLFTGGKETRIVTTEEYQDNTLDMIKMIVVAQLIFNKLTSLGMSDEKAVEISLDILFSYSDQLNLIPLEHIDNLEIDFGNMNSHNCDTCPTKETCEIKDVIQALKKEKDEKSNISIDKDGELKYDSSQN